MREDVGGERVEARLEAKPSDRRRGWLGCPPAEASSPTVFAEPQPNRAAQSGDFSQKGFLPPTGGLAGVHDTMDAVMIGRASSWSRPAAQGIAREAARCAEPPRLTCAIGCAPLAYLG